MNTPSFSFANEVPLEEFKAVCHKYLIISDDRYIDVIVGTIFANRLDSKPVWIYVVGPPGGGKTEILQAFSDEYEIFTVSTLTANTLISGKILDNVHDPDPSLLPKLDRKVMIIKDFTPLLSGKRETLMEVTGQLRDAYDGSCRKVFGTGKDTVYKSKFGVIAAVTNEIDRHRGILSDLGERFLTIRLPEVTPEEERERCRKASSNTITCQEAALRSAARTLLTNLPMVATVPEAMREQIITIAMFTAKARCQIHRDRETKEPEIPNPEIGTRLARQLCDLAIGIAMARGKQVVSQEEVFLVGKVALDSLNHTRIRVLQCLLSHEPEPISLQTVADALKASLSTVERWLEDLSLLDIVIKIQPQHPKAKLFSSERVSGFYQPSFWQLRDPHVLRMVWGKNANKRE
jgi:hypothetical protein